MTLDEAVSCFKEFLTAISINILSRVTTTFMPIHQVQINDVEEEQRRDCRYHRTKRSNKVPEFESVRVIWNTTRHSACTEEVHWEEGNVYSNEECSEMHLRQQIVILQPNDLFDSEVSSAENRKYSTH